MPRVSLNGVNLADSEQTVVVEGNHYFPPTSIHQSHFKPSSANTHTTCGWKGVASYYDIQLDDGTVVKDAAWYYPETKGAADNIKGYVAFYKSKVQIQ